MGTHRHLGRGSAMAAAATVLAAGCGTTHSASTRTLTAPSASHVLKGCYSLPFSGGTADLRPLTFYDIKTTTSAICFRKLAAGAKCAPAPGQARSYGDPIVDTDEPRSGDYAVIYYPSKHRWFMVPGCPS